MSGSRCYRSLLRALGWQIRGGPGSMGDLPNEMVVYAYWNVFGEVTITRVSGLFGVILILEMAV